jgi:hypothetical protein
MAFIFFGFVDEKQRGFFVEEFFAAGRYGDIHHRLADFLYRSVLACIRSTRNPNGQSRAFDRFSDNIVALDFQNEWRQ